MRRPSRRPGPRNDPPEVRLALSYDALKMKGTPRRRAIAARRPARSVACASLSMTQGPAMSTSGCPPPMARPPIVTGFTDLIIRARDAAIGDRSRLALDRDARGSRCGVRVVSRLVAVRCLDEAREERVRPRRLRLELRVELHRQEPGVARQLGDLDEAAVGRASGDPEAVLDERPLVEAVELV